jgi:hypothetical protein
MEMNQGWIAKDLMHLEGEIGKYDKSKRYYPWDSVEKKYHFSSHPLSSQNVSDEEYERRFNFALGEVASAWCQPQTGDIQMDIILAEEFARILVFHMYEPHLGCARTSELQEEIDLRKGREEANVEHVKS